MLRSSRDSPRFETNNMLPLVVSQGLGLRVGGWGVYRKVWKWQRKQIMVRSSRDSPRFETKLHVAPRGHCQPAQLWRWYHSEVQPGRAQHVIGCPALLVPAAKNLAKSSREPKLVPLILTILTFYDKLLYSLPRNHVLLPNSTGNK